MIHLNPYIIVLFCFYLYYHENINLKISKTLNNIKTKTLNKKMKSKGQGMIFLGITALISLTMVITLYVVLDNVIKTNIFDVGRTMGTNETLIDNMETTWDAFPWVFAGATFLSLVIYSLSRG